MGWRVEEDQQAQSKVRQRGDVGVRVGRPENSDGRDRDLQQRWWQHLDGQSYHERRRRVDCRQSTWTKFWLQLAAVSLFHSTCPLSHLSGNITKYARILRFHWRPQWSGAVFFYKCVLPVIECASICTPSFQGRNWHGPKAIYFLWKNKLQKKTCVIPQISLIKDHLVSFIKNNNIAPFHLVGNLQKMSNHFNCNMCYNPCEERERLMSEIYVILWSLETWFNSRQHNHNHNDTLSALDAKSGVKSGIGVPCKLSTHSFFKCGCSLVMWTSRAPDLAKWTPHSWQGRPSPPRWALSKWVFFAPFDL